MRYKAALWKEYQSKFLRHAGIAAGASLALTFLLGMSIRITGWQQYFFLFAGLFAIAGNMSYLINFMKGNLKTSGSVLSHAGFGILVLGIMISGLNNTTITSAGFVQQDFIQGEAVNRAVILIKDQPFPSMNYWMQYKGDTLVGNLRKYAVEFTKVDEQDKVLENFTTYPSAIYNREFTKIEALNPGNKRNLTYDVFTAAAPPPHMQDVEQAKAVEDSLKYLSYLVKPGSSFDEPTYFAEVGTPIFNYDFGSGDHGDTTKYDLTIGIPMDVTIKRTGEKVRVVPGLGLKNALVFQFPEVINELQIKIKVPESSFAQMFTEEDKLEYSDIALMANEVTEWNGFRIELSGFDRSGNYENYQAQEGDIALAANLNITTPNGRNVQQQPVFILRNAQQFSIKDYDPESALHIRFANIDPTTEIMSFRVAQDDRQDDEIELLIASGAKRSDILIVEANIFPGINLVWLGCLMMLGGLLLSLLNRRKTRT